MVLKLFDRRFATQLRRDEKVNPWTPVIERQYHHFILDGSASGFMTKLNSNNQMAEKEGHSWNDAQNEACLHDHMQNFYKTEVEVYDTLKDIQGEKVSRLCACVAFPSSSSTEELPLDRNYLDFPGILMQYIEGFPLTDVASHAPRETWQSLCEDAIQIVNLIGDRGVLNEDVKTRSFIVSEDPENKFKVFMIDFALCNFRREYEDEEDWRGWKAAEDEEGAVGYVMQRYLKGGFVYHQSAVYNKLDDDFKMED